MSPPLQQAKMCRRSLAGYGLGAILLAMSGLAPGGAAAQRDTSSKPHTFAVEGDHFVLDGAPFQVLSGELHYARIPREYWRARLQMARAMGLNTVATYVFWNVHEPRPGVYDFAGNNDLVAFLRMAQEEHMHVLLRAGPYACAEWEFGGFPSWLLKDPRMEKALRSNDPAFMEPVERWMDRLALEVTPMLAENGGPILAVQVENEYGNFGNEKGYMSHMLEIFQHSAFGRSFLYTVDPSKALVNGSLPGIFSGVNFGTGNAEHGLAAAAALRPREPLFATEYWPGWFDHWGHPHETRSTAAQVKDLDYIFSHKASVNIYMVHGGTSFGFMAGASWTGGKYLPDVTSYDYDAPIDEAGHPTRKFYAYREVFARYAGHPLPPVPPPPPVISIPAFTLGDTTSLWSHLPAPVESESPLTMEAVGQSYGYILYRKQLASAAHGPLILDQVHDYALVYLDGRLVGTVDRELGQDRLDIDSPANSRLDILVEDSGRVNSTRMMRGETKGITHAIHLGPDLLTGWKIYSLPMDTAPTMRDAAGEPHPGEAQTSVPHVAYAHFDLQKTGDTFLDTSALGKGALWINGHAMGRFWNAGPQKTLYVPGPWLRAGRNEVVVFDLYAASATAPTLAGRTTPILDAPTSGPVEHAPDVTPSQPAP